MNNSSTSIDISRQNEDHSLPYSVRDGESVEVLFDPLYESGPGGAINSTAHDMGLWVQMLLNGGKHQERQIIPQEFLERAFSNHAKIRDQFTFDGDNDILFDSYGYGWGVHDFKGHYKLQHGGNVSGFTASIEVYPLDNLGIVVLSNQHASNIVYHISNMISRRLLDLDMIPWNKYPVNTAQARPYGEALATINQEDPPTLALKAYEGWYYHPGYGLIEVHHREGQLYIDFPAFKMGLEHTAGDSFWNKRIYRVHENSPAFDMNFNVSESEVTSLFFPFLPNGAVFNKIK